MKSHFDIDKLRTEQASSIRDYLTYIETMKGKKEWSRDVATLLTYIDPLGQRIRHFTQLNKLAVRTR